MPREAVAEAPSRRTPVREEREFQTSILHHLKAGFPILYVNTWEEQRAEKEISDAALSMPRGMWIWSITRGWVQEHQGTPLPRADRKTLAAGDPVTALQVIHENKLPGDTVYVLRDFHFFIDGNPELIRKIRDMVSFLKSTGRTLIIEAPRVIIPVELTKDITLVGFSLPSRDDLGSILDGIVESVGADQARVSDRSALLDAACGLTVSEAENVLALALVKHGALGDDAIRSVQHSKADIFRKSGILEFYEPTETFAHLGGLNALKKYLGKRRRAYTDEARAYGLPIPRGMLLYGPPGCGKSFTAKTVASTWRLPLVRLDVGKLFAGIVGETESRTRAALSTVDAVGNCVLWLDELEDSVSGTQSSGYTDGGTTSRMFSTLVTWGSERKSTVYVIATSNDVTVLPAKLLRKGRFFDEIFFVDLPIAGEHKEIFSIHLTKRGRDPKKFDLNALASLATTAQFSGSEDEEAVISGMFDAFDNDEEVATKHIANAIENTRALAVTMEEQIKAGREWATNRARRATEIEDEPTRGRKIDTGRGQYL